MSKTELESRVLECMTLSALTLRQFRSTLSKLQAFQTTAKHIEQAFQQAEETADSINQTISEWEDIQHLIDESKELIKKLSLPGDPRQYLAHMDRAKQLLSRFEKRKDIDEAVSMTSQLAQYLGLAVSHCNDLIRKMLIEHHQIYGVTPINDDPSRLETLATIEHLVKAASQRSQTEVRKLYAQLRGKMLLTYIKLPPSTLTEKYQRGSYFLIKIIGALMEAMAVEVQLEQFIFKKQVVEDLLGEVVEEPFKFLLYNLESFFQGDLQIVVSFDVLGTLHQAIPVVTELLGKGGKLYSLNKMYSAAIAKCQTWYRETLSTLQMEKALLQEGIDTNTYAIYRYFVQLVDYTDVLPVCNLSDSLPNLITVHLDCLTGSLRPHLNKQNPIARVCVINNLAFWLGQQAKLSPIFPEAFLHKLRSDLVSEMQQFVKQTWSQLEVTMADETVEYTKSGALSRRSRKAIKQKFNAFNAQWNSITAQHLSISIYREEVLRTLRKLSYDLVYPKYQNFMQKYFTLDFTTRKQKYQQHPDEEIARTLVTLYQLKEP